MKVYKLTDILPLINDKKMDLKAVAKRVRKSEPTIWRWVKKLRDAGYEVKTRRYGKLNIN